MSEQERLKFDVVIVGAGPAGLSCAIRLKQLNPELHIGVLEKGAQPGAHILSGAVIETEPLDELIPDWRTQPPPICVPVKKDDFRLLTPRRALPLPRVFSNHGNVIVSLGAMCAWLAQHAEKRGVEIYPGFAAVEPLFNERNEVIGVRTGDMGVDKHGREKENFVAGVEIEADVTIVAEGCRGSLAKQLIARYQLDKHRQPQTYGMGMKELWQLPAGRTRPGEVLHTMGWPLDADTYGGGFVYHLDQDRVALGFVIGLDYARTETKPFDLLQQFKHHPYIESLLQGGQIVSAGARALTEGGWQSLPKMDMPGALLIGDAAGTLNVAKLKGTHLAMACGMLAAQHIYDANACEGFDRKFRESKYGAELRRIRNVRTGFQRGLWRGLFNAALETALRGKFPRTQPHRDDASALQQIAIKVRAIKNARETVLPPRDRLNSVYHANIAHEENQPVHLKITDPDICTTRCKTEYQNPCTRFCPAQVYEIVSENGEEKLQINAANCLHCKVCDIKDPYQIINWTPPEGGSGPNYQNM